MWLLTGGDERERERESVDYISLIFTRVLAYGFVERADRKRRHLGLGFERRDWPEAAPSWIRFRASPFLRFLLFLVVLLPVL